MKLRIASFNLWMSTPLQDDDKVYLPPSPLVGLPVWLTNDQRLQLVAQRLNEVVKPDICFFQEIDKFTDRSKLSNGTRVNQAEWLSKRTSMKYWTFDPYTLDYQWGQVGNAILSRFPFDKYFSHLIQGTTYGTSISDIYTTIEGKQFRCLGTHFNHRDENLRFEAAKYIVDVLLAQNPHIPVIFGGDLNLKPFTSKKDYESLRVLESRLTDSFYKAPPQYRFPENHCGAPDLPQYEHYVDYIFFQGTFKVKSWCAPCSTNTPTLPTGNCGGPDIPILSDHGIPRVDLEYGGSWSSWEGFAGPLNGPLNSGPAVSSWGLSDKWDVGRLDVFVKGNNRGLFVKQYDVYGWEDWKPLGGILTSDPAAVSWGHKRIDVFVRGTDNALWHKWYYNNTWYGWESLGGVLSSGPAVCSWGSGRLDVFVRGTDNALWHKWYYNNTWYGWESLGGVLTSDPAAVSWGPSRIDVFVRGTDNALWHKWYYNNTWYGWESLGGVLSSGPAVCSWGSGRLDVFVKATGDDLRQKWYDGQWHNWVPLGGVLTSDPDAVSWSSGRIDVFVRGTDNRLHHKWFA